MPRVFIPPPLRPLAGGRREVELPGRTVRELIEQLDEQYPGMGPRLCKGGRLRPELSVVIDSRVSDRGLLEAVSPTSEVHFVPLIAGG